MENNDSIRYRVAACREALDDGSGPELRMELSLRVQVRGREVRLQFEFPRPYGLKSSLQVVDELGKLGWQVAAEGRDG
jgi:hypothetical protein